MTHGHEALKRMTYAAVAMLLWTQQHALADSSGLATSVLRGTAVADELRLVLVVSTGIDAYVGEFVSAIDGVAAGGTETYEYEDAAQVLRDVLLSRENPFMLLAGHYEHQARALDERRGQLRFDEAAYAISEDRLGNCVTHYEERTLLDDHLEALRALGATIGNAAYRFDQAVGAMFVRSSGEGPVRFEAVHARQLLDAWLDGYQTLIEFPDPFRIVQNDALRYYLTIDGDTRPALHRLEAAVAGLHRDLETLVAVVDGEVTRLEGIRAAQPLCRFDGTWSGTCSFAGRATVNAALVLHPQNGSQTGTLSILGDTEFEVGRNGEITVYTVSSAALEIHGFRVLPIGVAVGVQFGLGKGGQPHGATFTGLFDNAFDRLSGNAGDEVDPAYMRCDLGRSTP